MPEDSQYLLYSVDKDGSRELVSYLDEGTVHLSGLGKHGGSVEKYVIGVKSGKGETFSEPFTVTWTDYKISVKNNKESRTVTISDLPRSVTVVVADYDEDGRFLGMELSEPQGEGTSDRQIVAPKFDADSAETGLFLFNNMKPITEKIELE